jgi:hypothetical protein
MTVPMVAADLLDRNPPRFRVEWEESGRLSMWRSPRSRTPSGLLGMIALVSVIEIGFSQAPLRFSDNPSLNWRLAVEDVAREAATVEIACLGDSLTKIAVVPEVIRAGTGKRTYNFAMARAPAQATYFVFRRLIEAGGRPSAVIVDFKSSIQAGPPRNALRHFQEIVNLREAWELARDAGSPSLLPPFLLGRLVPSIRYRHQIREAILCTLDGQAAPTLTTNRVALRNWTANLGNHFNTSESSFSGELAPQMLQNIGVQKWKCQQINTKYIHRLFDLAAAHSIPVYWIIPPLSPQLQDRRERTAVDDQYTEFARSMLANHPGVTVIDGRHSGYENPVFSDSTHLNGRGSRAFSFELAAILGRTEGRPRWIDLPRYCDRVIDIPVEDIRQSRVAIEGGTSRR